MADIPDLSKLDELDIATFIEAAYSRAGSAIQAVNPDALIIAEGPVNLSMMPLNAAVVNTNSDDGSYYIQDLSLAADIPVQLTVPHKLVYSVHDFPTPISANIPDSGAVRVQDFTRAWGYLVAKNIAPAWIGAMGASLDGNSDSFGDALAGEQVWASTLVTYLNGQDTAAGSPAFTDNEQPIGATWWLWGNQAVGAAPDGTLKPDGTLRPEQHDVYKQLAFVSGGMASGRYGSITGGGSGSGGGSSSSGSSSSGGGSSGSSGLSNAALAPPQFPGTCTNSFTGEYVINGKNGVVIDSWCFTNPGGRCLLITNSSNITIKNSTFKNCNSHGIAVWDSSNILIENNRLDSIGGKGIIVQDPGDGASGIQVLYNTVTNLLHLSGTFNDSCVQFNGVRGPDNKINYNQCIQDTLLPEKSGDRINAYFSEGTADGALEIIGNYVKGGSQEPSSAGIVPNDGGSKGSRNFILVAHNTIINTSASATGIQGGQYGRLVENLVYMEKRPWTWIALYYGNKNNPTPCNNNTIENNFAKTVDTADGNQGWFWMMDGNPSGVGDQCAPAAGFSGAPRAGFDEFPGHISRRFSSTESDTNCWNCAAVAAVTANSCLEQSNCPPGTDIVDLVTPTADLSVSKSDAPDPVLQGQNLSYTVTVTNNGPDDATSATLTDNLPAGVNFVSATPSQGTCTGAPIVNCDLGALANSASATVTIVVVPTVAGTIRNMVNVASAVNDSNQGNNVAVEDKNVAVEDTMVTQLIP